MDQSMDQESYNRWLIDEAMDAVLTPIDRVSEHKKYVIKSYLYARSRLFVPGRCYEDHDHGPLSAGGNAHADIIDLDNFLQAQHDTQLINETLDMMRDSSLDDVAYQQGLRHRSTIKRRRDKIVEKYAESSD